MNSFALAQVQPTSQPPPIGKPFTELRGALTSAGKKYGKPDYITEGITGVEIVFGNGECVFQCGGMVYHREYGRVITYGRHEVVSICEEFISAHGGKTHGTRPADWLAWFAEKFVPCKALLSFRDTKKQELLHDWASRCLSPRAPVTEDAPDRLSDPTNTPAPPVMAACPFEKG